MNLNRNELHRSSSSNTKSNICKHKKKLKNKQFCKQSLNNTKYNDRSGLLVVIFIMFSSQTQIENKKPSTSSIKRQVVLFLMIWWPILINGPPIKLFQTHSDAHTWLIVRFYQRQQKKRILWITTMLLQSTIIDLRSRRKLFYVDPDSRIQDSIGYDQMRGSSDTDFMAKCSSRW